MTHEELKNLEPGDIIRHVLESRARVVTGIFGSTVIAVHTAAITNPIEWHLIFKRGAPPQHLPRLRATGEIVLL